MWWGGWSSHHFSLHYSLCLDMSILRHLHTRIRESILSISLSSRLSRAIGQSPYQSRVLAVTSRCVYRPSVVQLLVWVFVCVCLVAFYLSLHCSRVSLRAHPLPFHSMPLVNIIKMTGINRNFYTTKVFLAGKKENNYNIIFLYFKDLYDFWKLLYPLIFVTDAYETKIKILKKIFLKLIIR